MARDWLVEDLWADLFMCVSLPGLCAGWCPYCQKVWLQLEEKRIPYVIEKINMRCYGDKPASFLAKVSKLVPMLTDSHPG